jgi:hypothetical protein
MTNTEKTLADATLTELFHELRRRTESEGHQFACMASYPSEGDGQEVLTHNIPIEKLNAIASSLSMLAEAAVKVGVAGSSQHVTPSTN